MRLESLGIACASCTIHIRNAIFVYVYGMQECIRNAIFLNHLPFLKRVIFTTTTTFKPIELMSKCKKHGCRCEARITITAVTASHRTSPMYAFPNFIRLRTNAVDSFDG